MQRFRQLAFSVLGTVAVLGGAQAFAQFPGPNQRPVQPRAPVQPRGENFSAGKTPQQLFASDCSDCHRAAEGLARKRPPNALGEFMRQHYTNSRVSASLLANYLNSVRNAAPPPNEPETTPAAVPRPPGSFPADGDVRPSEPPKPAAEQPPRQVPGGAAAKRNQHGGPVQSAVRQVLPPETPPEPKPAVPEIFD